MALKTSHRNDLADWIDTSVISEVILEGLEEEAISPTLENGKKVWLHALEELKHLTASSVLGLINRGDFQ
jgi:hypothetical protein